jgi:hypothetical protein
MDRPVHELAAAASQLLAREGAGGAGGRAQPASAKLGPLAVKCVCQQLVLLQRNPHPAFDVYPCEDDVSFWQVTFPSVVFILSTRKQRDQTQLDYRSEVGLWGRRVDVCWPAGGVVRARLLHLQCWDFPALPAVSSRVSCTAA